MFISTTTFSHGCLRSKKWSREAWPKQNIEAFQLRSFTMIILKLFSLRPI